MVNFMDAEGVKNFFKVLRDGGLDKIKGFKPIVSDRDNIDKVIAVLEGDTELEGSERGAFLWKKADHYRGVQNAFMREGTFVPGGERIHVQEVYDVLELLKSDNPGPLEAQRFYGAVTTALLNGALQY